jgi:hypothetical protein
MLGLLAASMRERLEGSKCVRGIGCWEIPVLGTCWLLVVSARDDRGPQRLQVLTAASTYGALSVWTSHNGYRVTSGPMVTRWAVTSQPAVWCLERTLRSGPAPSGRPV